jgi:uncharacterized protein Yka (UPF0111/DUF47 family)
LKNFKGILVLGEKNIFSELSQMISLGVQANVILKVMYQNSSNQQLLTENMHLVRTLEKKSDDIAFMLNEEITSGAVSPNIIDGLIDCIRLTDNIVDLFFYLSRELSRMPKADTKNFAANQETEWRSVFEDMLALTNQSLIKLQQMLSTGNVSNMLQLRKEIESLEEKGDDIKDTGFDKLYQAASHLHFLQFYHYSEMLHKCDDILDTAEDLSDVIVSTVTSILK